MKTILSEMINAVRASGAELRARVSKVRLGKPGTILFDFDGETWAAPEPYDVIVTVDVHGTNAEAARSWCVKQLLNQTATKA